MSYSSATSLCHNLRQHSKLCIQRKSLCVILSKKFDTFSFLNCATNQKIAFTRLASATELQTMHHLITKDKASEQHILQKHSKCNSFRVISHLLRVAKMVIAMLKCYRLCRNSVLLYSDT